MNHTQSLVGAPHKPFDWGALHRRLDASEEALRRCVTSSEERTETVLRERAKQLAIPGESETNDYFDVLAFQLGAESYGVELCHTTGVHFLRDLMPVPLSPPFVVGAINLRGTVVSVLDLGRLLEVPGSAVVERDQIIALHFEEVEVALMTDRISGVRRVSRSQLQPGLPNLSGMNASYVEGITRDRMILLDVKRLLSDPKISAEGEF